MEDKKVVAFLKDCYATMDFGGLSFNEESVLKTIKNSISNGGYFTTIEDEGKINGMLAVGIVPNIMDYSQMLAVEYIWHVHPGLPKKEKIKLMEELIVSGIEWAKKNKFQFRAGTNVHSPGAEKILKRNGFYEVEKLFVKEV